MTFVVTASWTPRDGADQEVETILKELVRSSREEPGCLEFIAHHHGPMPTTSSFMSNTNRKRIGTPIKRHSTLPSWW